MKRNLPLIGLMLLTFPRLALVACGPESSTDATDSGGAAGDQGSGGSAESNGGSGSAEPGGDQGVGGTGSGGRESGSGAASGAMGGEAGAPPENPFAPGAIPLHEGWPQVGWFCHDLAIFGDSLVVARDEQDGQELFRYVRALDLETGEFRAAELREPVDISSATGERLHLAASGENLALAAPLIVENDRRVFAVWMLDGSTLEIEKSALSPVVAYPKDVAVDEDRVYVADDGGKMQVFSLPDLTQEEYYDADRGLLYAHRVALGGDWAFFSLSGIGQPSLMRMLRNGDPALGFTTNAVVPLREVVGDHFPWTLLTQGDSVYALGVAESTHIWLLRLSMEDGTLLADQPVNGSFGDPVFGATNSSGIFYTRGEKTGDDPTVYSLVRASLDDLTEQAKTELIYRPVAVVADEDYLYMCSPYGIHRFSTETLELAGR